MKHKPPKPHGVTVDETIAQAARQASADHDNLKAKFTKAFTQDPTFAVQWLAEAVVKAQTRELWWRRLADAAQRQGARDAIADGKRWAQGEIDHFFRRSTTSPWHNGCRRAEAEVYSALLREEVVTLEKALECEGGVTTATPTD
ncbi:MAG: hypothetical protein NTW96_05830 [Planctomycetia bacterium]|nr:hypothetical protein [Planctomycetia bacterium]